MSLHIVRNDISKMNTQAIVNTTSDIGYVGAGCDTAINQAAGPGLNQARLEVGFLDEGQACITPGFDLAAEYVIHAVSPIFIDGNSGEADRLRDCYRNSLNLAKEYNLESISFPLISSGSFGYPKEEALMIAKEEIDDFLLDNDIEIYMVVFDDESTRLARDIKKDILEYISRAEVESASSSEYSEHVQMNTHRAILGHLSLEEPKQFVPVPEPDKPIECPIVLGSPLPPQPDLLSPDVKQCEMFDGEEPDLDSLQDFLDEEYDDFRTKLMKYIEADGRTNAQIYNASLVNKKTFSKIKNQEDYHPSKLTCMCFAVGLRLDMEDAEELLETAGYAFSRANKTDLVFRYFIENRMYDMLELDIALEELGLDCILQ